MRSIKSFVLPRLRRIANAQSVKEHEQAVSDLKESDEWKADTPEKFRNYVSKTWLPVYRVSDALKTNERLQIFGFTFLEVFFKRSVFERKI